MSFKGLELIGVCKQIGHAHVLRDASLRLAHGTNTAILGRSGSGKSTLLRVLAGLDVPSRGRVMLNGTVATEAQSLKLPPHQRGIAMVFQDLALWPNLTALASVILGLSGLRLSHRDAVGRARGALALCGIEAFADRRPGTLSGGEQQRLALARAIAVRPMFLFLDEPFAGLDLLTKQKLLDDIAALAQEHAMTILLVTHDPWECRQLCDDVTVLEGGRIVENGPLTQLVSSATSDLLRSFLRFAQPCPDLEHS